VTFASIFAIVIMFIINGVYMATDFTKILEDLRSWGLNDYKMADLVDLDRSTLSKLRKGDRKQPGYDDGVKIMEIYKKEAKRKR
jgi:hypothetical protein